MFDGSLPWSVGVGEGEWSWRALGAPKRLSSDGFVMTLLLLLIPAVLT